MKTPLVSVIIPTYNNANYIREAITSILNQSYQSFEIIVVDDGSTDHTIDILGDYIGKNLIRYRHQVNKGPGEARNTGITLAKGEYIAFLDADDSLTSDSLEKRIELMTATPTLKTVFSNYYVRSGENDRKIAIDEDFLCKWENATRITEDGFLIKGAFPDLFEIPFFIWTGSILLKKSLFRETGLFRTDVIIGEDRDMWIRVIEHSPEVGYVASPLSCYNKFRGVLTSHDPVKYARIRETFNFALLEKYRGLDSGNKISRVIHKRLSWIYYDLGIHFSGEKRKMEALNNIVRSIYYDPGNQVSSRLLVSLLIPDRVKYSLKKILGSPHSRDAA